MATTDTAADGKKKSCIACGAQISSESYICSTCKEYQRRWRNELRYWAAFAGLVTLICTGVVVIPGFLKSAWDYLQPPDLVVLDFDAFEYLTMVNPSNQPVLAKYFYIRSLNAGQADQWTVRWDINESIDAGKSLAVHLAKLAEKQFKGPPSDNIFGRQQGAYAQNLTEDVRREFLSYRRNKEFVPAFLKDGGTEHQHVKEDIGTHISTFSCAAEMSYMFLQRQTERKNSIACIGIIKHRVQPAG
jgi:hypothetical protein